MEIFWNIFFWISLVAIVGIIAGVIIKVATRMAESREYIADANNGGKYKELAERNDSTNVDILAKLGKVEQRLDAIEKTLTEIP